MHSIVATCSSSDVKACYMVAIASDKAYARGRGCREARAPAA
jgi:hypothetical protein